MQTGYSYRNKITGEFFDVTVVGDPKKDRSECTLVLTPKKNLKHVFPYADDNFAKEDFERCIITDSNSSKEDWEFIEIKIEWSWNYPLNKQ